MFRSIAFFLLLALTSMQLWGQEIVGQKNYDECDPQPLLIVLRGLESQLSALTGNDETRDYAINEFVDLDQKWYRAYQCEALVDSINSLQAQIEGNSGSVPTVTTSGSVNAGDGICSFAGTVTDAGGGTISAVGVVLSTEPTFSSSVEVPFDSTDEGSSMTGSYITEVQTFSEISYSLVEVFYWKAFATNQFGTGYGEIYYGTPDGLFKSPTGTLYVD